MGMPKTRGCPKRCDTATVSFRIRLPFTRIQWIRHTNQHLFNPLSRVENFECAVKSGIVWTLNPDIFIGWRNNIEPSSLSWILYSRWRPRRLICCQFSQRSPPGYQSESRFGWKGKFDLNTHTRRKFWNRKKKVADSKISGYVSYNSRFYSPLYVGIIKLNLKGQIPLKPTS